MTTSLSAEQRAIQTLIDQRNTAMNLVVDWQVQAQMLTEQLQEARTLLEAAQTKMPELEARILAIEAKEHSDGAVSTGEPVRGESDPSDERPERAHGASNGAIAHDDTAWAGPLTDNAHA